MLASADNVVDPEDHASALDGSFDGLNLDREGLVKSVSLHVVDLSRDTVDAEVAPLPGLERCVVLSPELGDGANDAHSAVRGKGAGDDLHCVTHGHVRPLHDPLNLEAGLGESAGDGHFGAPSAEEELGLEDDVPDNLHGVLEVPLDLVKDVLAATAKEDSAGLGVLALLEEGEVLVPKLPDLEESAAGSNVRLLDLVSTGNNGGTSGAGDTVVVRLPEPPEGSDVGLGEVVLC